jgi:hypothetical protein
VAITGNRWVFVVMDYLYLDCINAYLWLYHWRKPGKAEIQLSVSFLTTSCDSTIIFKIKD